MYPCPIWADGSQTQNANRGTPTEDTTYIACMCIALVLSNIVSWSHHLISHLQTTFNQNHFLNLFYFIKSSTYRLTDREASEGVGAADGRATSPSLNSNANSPFPFPPPPPPLPKTHSNVYQLCQDKAPSDKWQVGSDIWPENTLHVFEAEVLDGALQALVVIEGAVQSLNRVNALKSPGCDMYND